MYTVAVLELVATATCVVPGGAEKISVTPAATTYDALDAVTPLDVPNATKIATAPEFTMRTFDSRLASPPRAALAEVVVAATVIWGAVLLNAGEVMC